MILMLKKMILKTNKKNLKIFTQQLSKILMQIVATNKEKQTINSITKMRKKKLSLLDVWIWEYKKMINTFLLKTAKVKKSILNASRLSKKICNLNKIK